jgi:hypothetical protein
MWTDPEFAREVFAVTGNKVAVQNQIQSILSHHGFGDVSVAQLQAAATDFCAVMQAMTVNFSAFGKQRWQAYCQKVITWGGGDVVQ